MQLVVSMVLMVWKKHTPPATNVKHPPQYNSWDCWWKKWKLHPLAATGDKTLQNNHSQYIISQGKQPCRCHFYVSSLSGHCGWIIFPCWTFLLLHSLLIPFVNIFLTNFVAVISEIFRRWKNGFCINRKKYWSTFLSFYAIQ